MSKPSIQQHCLSGWRQSLVNGSIARFRLAEIAESSASPEGLDHGCSLEASTVCKRQVGDVKFVFLGGCSYTSAWSINRSVQVCVCSVHVSCLLVQDIFFKISVKIRMSLKVKVRLLLPAEACAVVHPTSQTFTRNCYLISCRNRKAAR